MQYENEFLNRFVLNASTWPDWKREWPVNITPDERVKWFICLHEFIAFSVLKNENPWRKVWCFVALCLMADLLVVIIGWYKIQQQQNFLVLGFTFCTFYSVICSSAFRDCIYLSVYFWLPAFNLFFSPRYPCLLWRKRWGKCRGELVWTNSVHDFSKAHLVASKTASEPNFRKWHSVLNLSSLLLLKNNYSWPKCAT